MAPSTIGNRLRRAAVVTLLGLIAVGGQPGNALAQQLSGGDIGNSDAVISDIGNSYDGGTTNFGGATYENATPCDGCYGSCDGNCGDCEPCYGECGACGQDCYKHYCPVWIGAEWIHWRLDGNRLPPLVTNGPANTPLANVARLNDPGTRILSGDDGANDDWRDGFRVFGGYWFDCCHTCGVGYDYFDVGDDDYDFVATPDPTRVVGRPFFNTELGLDDVQFVSVPNELDGTVRVKSNDEFKGAGITFNRCLYQCCNPCCETTRQLNLLGGYRFYEYETNLSITENLIVLPGTNSPLVPGTTFFVQDRIRTHNEFNGGEIGLQGFSKHCWWWYDGMAKLAMGSQRRMVTVDGETITVVPGGGTAVAAGGLLTSAVTNIGHYDDSDFVVIPEFRLGLGGMVTHYCAIRAGYNVILWGDVARAASHLPPGLQVDPRNLPPIQGGGQDPEFPGIRGSQLIAHGFDVSVMFEF